MMNRDKDYYSILGVDKTADKATIKKAFRQLSKQYHPDRNPGNKEAEEKFKDINEAYSVLGDEQKRQEYDNPQPELNFGGFDPFGGINPFWGQRHQQNTTINGETITLNVYCTLNDIYNTTEKQIRYRKRKKCTFCDATMAKTTCPDCHGTGVITSMNQSNGMSFITNTTCPHCQGTGVLFEKRIKTNCPHCHDTGLIDEEVTLKLNLADCISILKKLYGVEHTYIDKDTNKEAIMVQPLSPITIPGAGHDTVDPNGQSGNLIIKLIIRSMPDGWHFSRDNKLIYILKLNPIDLLRGKQGQELEFPDSSKIRLNIKECSKPNTTLSVRNKGLKLSQSERDVFYVILDAAWPDSLTESERNLLSQIDDLN